MLFFYISDDWDQAQRRSNSSAFTSNVDTDPEACEKLGRGMRSKSDSKRKDDARSGGEEDGKSCT